MKSKQIKQEEAKARDTARAKRSPHEQLALLDRKYGKGVGSTKERARLTKQIASKSNG